MERTDPGAVKVERPTGRTTLAAPGLVCSALPGSTVGGMATPIPEARALPPEARALSCVKRSLLRLADAPVGWGPSGVPGRGAGRAARRGLCGALI